LGLAASELRKLAEHGPEAAGLLTRRMAELNLDRNDPGRVKTIAQQLIRLALPAK